MIAAPLYLFQLGDTDRHAISRDKTGCNLPKDGHPWLLRGHVTREEIEENIASVSDELKDKGFCILHITPTERD